METYASLLGALARARLSRADVVVALGGGVTGDMTGFAAATYLRGVSFVQIPTTLLAMVDSSVGGKTAVDLDSFKNMIGCFKQPREVFIDLAFLKTLPFEHITSGLGEVVKTALLDKALFEFVNKNIMGLVSQNRETVSRAVEMCLRIKSDIVSKDEKESGLRRRLNAGHTFGHALETLFSYKAGHGEYVLNGIYYELALSRILGFSNGEYAKSVFRLIGKLLPKRLSVPEKKYRSFLDIACSDKKNKDGGIAFVFPANNGEIREESMSREGLMSRLGEVFSYVSEN
jgi:3-dehydroquinate synthase